jgi:hypothetical protein
MMDIVYAQHRVALKAGQVQRNPRYFTKPEPGVKRAVIHGHWPAIEQAHREAGVKVERADGEPSTPMIIKPPSELAARLAERVVPREGRFGGVALVIGSAGCVWDDAAAALELGEFQGVVGCNLAAIYWPGQMDAWVTLHFEKFNLWAERRRRARLPPHRSEIGLKQTLPHFAGQTSVGSSGLYALKVALIDLGYERAVLCGVPMSHEAAHFDDPKPWKSAHVYRKGWLEALPEIKDRARSMGGWSAELLGRPGADWIANG